MENKELARQILAVVGPKGNVRQATHCMTRLRLVLADQDVDREALKKLPGVMGVNQAGPELQIILGPGKATQVTDEFNGLLAAPEETGETPEPEKTEPEPPRTDAFPKGEVGDGKALHEAIRAKNATPAKLFLKRISSIFVPLIPGFIGC